MSDQVETLVLPTTDGGTVRASVVSVAKADEQGNQLQLTEGGVRDIFAHESGALDPPYSPTSLQHWFEHSNALRQNVDAMVTNIDGFGHTYAALVNLDADDTKERVAAFIRMERQADTGEVQVAEPTDAEIEERMKELRNGQVMEKLRLEHFFKYAADSGFTKLRKVTRQDIETTGNGYWEVVRDQGGKLRRFNHLPTQTIRLLPMDKVATRRNVKRHTLVNTMEVVEEDKRFRRFVQQVGESKVYFKEYGDPRVVSSNTGKHFPDVDSLLRAEPNGRAATEVVHFKIHTSRSGYGVPRWIGNILSVLGSRECEEVNYGYFQNKSVPPLAVIVSNGRLGADSRAELQNYIRTHIRGKENFHSVLIIEAQSAEGSAFENSGQAQVKLQPLTEAQMNDALFENYDERNIDKVGMSFRLPRMLRGDTRDFNRSTAIAALDMAERQVFEPERTEFDEWINRNILPELDAVHWQIQSRGPVQRDPESLSKMIHDSQDFMTPNMLIELSEQVFNRPFSRINEDWANQPLKVTLAQMNIEAKVASAGAGEGDGLQDDSGEAEDANPDNNKSKTEPESSHTEESDNKDRQPRSPDGKFGSTRKPTDTSVRGASRRAKRSRTKKSLTEAVDNLVELRDELHDELIEQATARAQARRA